MTTLTITPNWKNKTARFKGTIAAGEHVAVRIVNDNGEGDEYIQAEDLANLRLRVVSPMNGKTLAQFPMPEPEEEILPTVALEDEEEDAGEETSEESGAESPSAAEAETWGGLTPLTCELNLNTDRMLMAVPPGANVPLLFVLDAYEGATDEDEGEFTLYFKDLCEVTHWPRRRGEDEPTRLDDYKDLIKDFRERIDAAEDSIRDAVDVANGIVAHVDAAKIVAQNSATAAGDSATNAQTSAATAKNWATGGGETGDPGAENNAKYYAQQAGASATSAETSATSAATAAANAEAWAVGKRNGVDVPSTDATYENNAKHYATAAAASAQKAEETLENKADKATTLAGYGITDAYTKTETDGKISTAVSAEATARNTAISIAISAVKDSAPEAFDTLKEIADWIGDDQSGAAAMAAQISSHTSQLSQLSQNKVDKVAGKGLSTNDYTTAEKTKLGGVEAGAKDNVVEAAGASAFPQTGVTGKIYVAKDENKTYRWDGTQYVQIGGGSSVDVVPPSTDSADAGKAADAKATGDALAGKRGLDDLELYKKVGVGDTWTLVATQSGYEGITTTVTGVFSGDEPAHWEFYLDGEGVAGSSEAVDADSCEVQWTGGEEVGLSGIARRPFTYQPVTGDALAKTSQLPDASTTAPQMDGTASAGSSAAFARGDHVHPTDTTKQDAISDLAAIRSGAAAGATAVQPSALAEAVRYDLPASVTNIADATQEEVEGGTIYYAEATLADRKANWLIVTTLLDELRLTFPAVVSGKVRDFGLRLEIGSQLTAPALVMPVGVTVENPDGAIPELADGTDTATGVTLLYFSETSPGKFLVKGEQVKEVA